MKNYLVTFGIEKDVNSPLAVRIRTKLEKFSPEHWIQIFPNQLAIKTTLTIEEINKMLAPEASKTRISIVEFQHFYVNEERSSSLLEKYDY
ncbi:MAG: hypothetical protein RR936_06815 [Carnobacterium sp.]|uniref:hypothetical protein n=1 Tax=Carnobacterium sp. TaxID=48221 RepID=UPI002FCC7239